MPSLRLCLSLAMAAFGLTACQAQHTMHLPEAPVAREIYPDHDAYRRFRADNIAHAPVTVCAIDGVGFVPTLS
jgi:hypothetical protein